MYQSINVYDFRDAFSRMGRQDQFSYKALGWLFDHLEDYEAETGEKVELDVIALCCDYNEMTWKELVESYNIDLSAVDPDDVQEFLSEWICEQTFVVNMDDDVVLFQCF